MALHTKTVVSLEIKDGGITNFNSGSITTQTMNFDQNFGGDIKLPAGADDVEVSLQHIQFGQVIFLKCDQPIRVKLVVSGQTVSTTPYLVLYENMPSLLSSKNVIQIFVSNPTTSVATLVCEGAGVTSL